jgi:nucleoside-diphosphate-sugar epimerase
MLKCSIWMRYRTTEHFDIKLFEVEVMRVLVIGATGYVGGVLVERLAERGHEVVAFVRPPADGSRRVPQAVEERYGDLADPASLAAALTPGLDTGDREVDLKVAGLLAGRNAVYVSGVWVLGPVDGGDEDSPVNPIALVGYRPDVEREVLDGGGAVVRPGVVHGRDTGIVAMMRAWAAERGAGVYVSADGSSPTWTFVHVDDLADLLVSVAEQRLTGVFHAIAEEAVPVAEVAAAGYGRAEPWPVEDAAGVLGEGFAEALALSQRAGAPRTRRVVGWNPVRPGILDNLG